MTATSAPRIATAELQKFVDRVTEALGHPDAFVTDESIVGDMLEIGGTAFRMRRGGRHSTDPWVEMPGDPEIARRNADVLRRASETLKSPLSRPTELSPSLADSLRSGLPSDSSARRLTEHGPKSPHAWPASPRKSAP